MKFTVAFLLLAAVSVAAKPNRKNQENNEDKQDKRGLVEGNSGIEKRAPLLPTVPPAAGGVEYANTKQTLSDKSPAQQIYATPEPQISKISDFLSGQTPSFQSAIASHLYSPISVYNPKYENPTTYEVSAPVPSQLAYTEHRLSVPPPNSLQFNTKPPKLTNYVQPQVLRQQSFEQNNLGNEPIVHQISNNAINNNILPVQYNQDSQEHIEQQRMHYIQGQPLQIIPRNIQQHPILNRKQHLEQRDLKNQPAPAQVLNKQKIQQLYNDKQQKALSFASFTYNPSSEAVAPSYEQTQNQQLYTQSQQSYVQPQPQPHVQLQPQPQPQPQLQHQYQPQQIIQAPQLQQYQTQGQSYDQIPYQFQQPAQLPQLPYQIPQELQYQSPQQLQYQPQSQIQYKEDQSQLYQQIPQQFLQPQLLPQGQTPQYIQQQNYQPEQTQPQYFEKSEQIAKQNIVDKQYIKQAPIQPQFNQQVYPQQQLQNLSYKQPSPGVPSLPTFPPVQYFGKFAHSIFGNSQH